MYIRHLKIQGTSDSLVRQKECIKQDIRSVMIFNWHHTAYGS